jgi:hypothetical protein
VTDRKTGGSGWLLPEPDTERKWPPPSARQPPYLRSVGWAILAWAVTVGVVYVISQVLDMPEFGGWIGFAGFLISYWIGGSRGGINGRQEWLSFVVILSAVAFLAFWAGIIVYSMALYG